MFKAVICERLISVVSSNDRTRQGLTDLLPETLHHLKIKPLKCLSDSTDNAASYHCQYNGLRCKITDVADQHVPIWRYPM